MLRAALILSLLAVAPGWAQTGEVHTVEAVRVSDRKAVFATVESVDTVTARARLGGTIGELRVDEGDAVEAGSVLAVVVNERLAPQIGSVNAQAAALNAQLAQARIDLERAQDLFSRGIFLQARLDQASTQVEVLEGQLASVRRERDVLVQQAREGDVLAPAAGRVLQVPVTAGTVVMPGEPIAMIASDLYLLRLRLPERYARSIEEGDAIEVDAAALSGDVAAQGQIRQAYPRIEDGRIVADALVDGLGGFFVGERVRVYVSVDERDAVIIPADYVSTRYGVDYVHLVTASGETAGVSVLRGPETEAGVEILSGIAAGDQVLRP